jgi:hypothetical protein
MHENSNWDTEIIWLQNWYYYIWYLYISYLSHTHISHKKSLCFSFFYLLFFIFYFDFISKIPTKLSIAFKLILELVCSYILKCFFTKKCIKIIFFYFLKIIFDISLLKWYKNIKKILNWSKEKNKKILIFFKNIF